MLPNVMLSLKIFRSLNFIEPKLFLKKYKPSAKIKINKITRVQSDQIAHEVGVYFHQYMSGIYNNL